ncbi:peptidoglycan bridge formation glycyltransferase FemA/FemB family protein [Candidatus Roizmanbacteria bacterium]|nr:peptidoglycan bridge formation glycyltransferase FemA/FemB family protein [Candidatus Roizmanbacteria bacterium]
MTISILPETFNSQEYNTHAHHPLQAWQWGEGRKRLGTEVLRLGEYDNEKLTRTYQLTLHPIPYTSFKLAYMARSVFPSVACLDFLREYALKNNIIFVKLEPDELKSEKRTEQIAKIKDLKLSSHPLFPSWTLILDISKPEEVLLNEMKPKTRYNIRLAQKKGVTVREESNEVGFKIFSKLYFDTCHRQKYFGHSPHYHQVVWEAMKEGIAHIVIAYYQNTPLAAYELFYFDNKLYYPYGGTSTEYRNLMGANLIMWEAIRLGKSLGATVFDMWGSLGPMPENSTHPWAGFTRFKEGYNAVHTEMIGSYDLVVNPLAYTLYSGAYKLRSGLLQMKRAFMR